jgi:hypothetical protein
LVAHEKQARLSMLFASPPNDTSQSIVPQCLIYERREIRVRVAARDKVEQLDFSWRDNDWRRNPGKMMARKIAKWWVALAVGWAAAAVAGPTEDFLDAATHGDVAAVQSLLANRAEVNFKKGVGGLALILASQNGHLDVVQTLLANGAAVNAKTTNDGVTALMLASLKGYREVVQALLSKEAYVNAKDRGGGTALMLASQGGHREVVQALLAKGADVNVKTSDGRTALTLVKDEKVKALLEQAGAKP